jgi:hypothetical protein
MKEREANARATRQPSRRQRDRVPAGDDVTTPNGEARGSPDLDALRASVKVTGWPLSREVIEDR